MARREVTVFVVLIVLTSIVSAAATISFVCDTPLSPVTAMFAVYCTAVLWASFVLHLKDRGNRVDR